jgi:DNA-binding beta-propeller fold protein YncE
MTIPEQPKLFESAWRVAGRAVLCAAMLLGMTVAAQAQQSSAPSNDLPNPYKTTTGWAQLPDGRKWGATDGIDISPEGNIWVFDRCGANGCADSNLPAVLEFDPSGKLLKSFGAGMFVFPHGVAVQKNGDLWLTDAKADKGKGLQVFKFSPDGKLLLTLGKAGVAGETEDAFGSPTDVAVSATGDIFISDGHKGCDCPNSRILKFSREGKFIKSFGKKGSGPGELDMPHSLAFDSQGRLFVADRSNNRVAIFDQDGKFITAWKQFGRPSGIFIDANDVLYVADSESRDSEGYGNNPGVRRGIRIGSAKTGEVKYFIPGPDPQGSSSAAEGVAADHQGNIYGAEVKQMDVKKYVKQ